jgi:hypothetical protein
VVDVEDISDGENTIPSPPPFPRPSPKPSPSLSTQSTINHRPLKQKNSQGDLTSAMASYLEVQTARATMEKEDEDLLFFKSILPVLKKIPEHQKEQLKAEFHQSILKVAYPQSPSLPTIQYGTFPHQGYPTHGFPLQPLAQPPHGLQPSMSWTHDMYGVHTTQS